MKRKEREALVDGAMAASALAILEELSRSIDNTTDRPTPSYAKDIVNISGQLRGLITDIYESGGFND